VTITGAPVASDPSVVATDDPFSMLIWIRDAVVNLEIPCIKQFPCEGVRGQRFADIRIVNLHYKDTVEADVYQALRNRICIFESVVGGLQPILTRLPRLIEESILSKVGDEAAKGAAAVRALEGALAEGSTNAIDLDDFSDADLDLSPRPDPTLTLADLRAVLDKPRLMLPGTDAKPLGEQDFRYEDGDIPAAIRVTVDPAFFEEHSDSVEFWTPGSPAFPQLDQFA
jgi:hypothetical protein